MKVGLLSDSAGDIEAFAQAMALLEARGAERFFFLGGRWADVDEFLLHRKRQLRGGREYGDQDFIADVREFLATFGDTPLVKLANADEVSRLRSRFSRAPCREDLEWFDPRHAQKLMEMVGNQIACLVHDKSDLVKDDMVNAMLLIHGRSPDPNVVQIGPRFFVTPGRLTGAAEQTCALLETLPGELRFEAFTLAGVSVRSLQFALGSRNKMSVG